MSAGAIATPYALPYRAALQPPPLLSGGRKAILRVVAATTLDDAGVGDYDSVMTAFGVLALTGALAGTAGPPARAAAFDWSRPRRSGAAVEWELSRCVFDERAAIMLAQLFMLSHMAHPISGVAIFSPGGAAAPLAYDPSLEDPYPPIWQPAPFPASIDPDIHEAAVLRIRFSRTPDLGEQQHIRDPIINWGVATTMGAYGVAPVPPNECFAQFDPVIAFLKDELEFELVRLRAHPSCLHGLVNVCIALHQSVLPITELHIA
jgi:hypothetical protein